jgi:hypothetical protein
MWPGTFTWRVKVANAAGQESAWSEPQTFCVGTTCNPPTQQPSCATGEGVTLYDAASFGSGTCHTFGPGDYSNLSSFGLSNNVSSIGGAGYHVTLFDQPGLSGTPGYFDGEQARLDGYWNDRARSMRVERLRDTSCNPGTDGIILYRESNYRASGGCLFVTGDIVDLTPLTYEQRIGSVKFVGSYRRTKQLLAYSGTNHQNLCKSVWQNWSDFRGCGNEIMSLQVRDFTPPLPVPPNPGDVFVGNIAQQAYLYPPEASSVADGIRHRRRQRLGAALQLGWSGDHSPHRRLGQDLGKRRRAHGKRHPGLQRRHHRPRRRHDRRRAALRRYHLSGEVRHLG